MPRLDRRTWTPSESPFGGRRRRIPYAYDACVPDRIAAWDAALPAALAAEVGDAEALLRSASADVSLVGMEALSRHLLRAESLASSRIEGLVVSHRRVAEAAFDPAHVDETARSVLANVAAMEEAIRIGARRGPLGVRDLVAIHRTLFRGTRDTALAGTVRTTQNWIGGRSDGPAGAEFVPPPPEIVGDLLSDLAAFSSRDDLPPLVQAAIAHAQFETIHPFPDGNGRAGRCLVHVILRRGGHGGSFVPPVSLALAGDAAAYVRGLGDFRSGAWDAWVGTFVAAARLAALRTRDFAESARATLSRWREECGARRGSVAARAVDSLPANPVLDVRRLAEALGCSDDAARAAIGRLSGAGILTPTTLGRRNRAYVARGCLELLNDFERSLLDPRADRSRRRAPRRPPTSPPRPEIAPAESALLWSLTHGPLTLSELRRATGRPGRQVQALLARLRGRGLARLTGRARTARWSLTAAGRTATEEPRGADSSGASRS